MHKIPKWIFLVVGFLLIIFFLGKVFSGSLILPQSFPLGPLSIHYYGLIMALAAASGFYLAIKRAPRFGVNPKQAEDILFWTIVGGFIGARIYHVFSSIGYYWAHPINSLKVWNGGLSIYGAVLGGILVIAILKRIFNLKSSLSAEASAKVEILNLLDWLAPSILLGQIIGRFGNLFNYEAFGYPTNLPWKMYVPEQFRPPAFIAFNYFHPFFLYEALGNIIILFLLLKVLKFKRPGEVVFSYLLLYNSLRFCLEFLRIDSTFLGIVRLNALTSFILICFSAICLFIIDKNDQKLKK
jgi:phosphatidylglycerol:prolipoprotein diacylglycerol transferase